jgi:hypothetical protein
MMTMNLSACRRCLSSTLKFRNLERVSAFFIKA